MKKIAIVLTFTLFCLLSCGTISEGIVIEKHFTPALTYGPYGPPWDEYLLVVEGNMNSKTITKKVSDEKLL